MPFPEVMQSLGDAISGTDREAAYRKGMGERADIDYTEAQTEAALQLARDRRLEAEKKERQRAAEELLREQLANMEGGDQTGIDPFGVMAAGLGDEYAGLQLGRTRAQEYNLQETIATPSMGFGDDLAIDPGIAHEYEREAALEALSPNAALASRRMGPDYEMVLQPDGSSIYIPSRLAAGQPVGGRPSNAGGSSTNAGGLPSAVSSLIFRQASALYGGTYDPLTGRFAGLDREAAASVQRIASRASVIFRQGGVDPQTAVDQALTEAQAAAQAGTEIPPQFGDAIDAGGATDDVDPSTGQPWEATDAQGNRVRWINGQWQPAP